MMLSFHGLHTYLNASIILCHSHYLIISIISAYLLRIELFFFRIWNSSMEDTSTGHPQWTEICKYVVQIWNGNSKFHELTCIKMTHVFQEYEV